MGWVGDWCVMYGWIGRQREKVRGVYITLWLWSKIFINGPDSTTHPYHGANSLCAITYSRLLPLLFQIFPPFSIFCFLFSFTSPPLSCSRNPVEGRASGNDFFFHLPLFWGKSCGGRSVQECYEAKTCGGPFFFFLFSICSPSQVVCGSKEKPTDARATHTHTHAHAHTHTHTW